MKLKRLQIQGFKSFADKTELVFDHGIVSIVGPNGCGKSNIVDCIRWAMGEQSAKGLRGKEMSDVIFAGTPARKAGGLAEVTLVFDNSGGQAPAPYTEFSEISVTRRLYRTGESEYEINKTAARLKDVNDLFLGTGSSAKAYSIVAQGKVDQIVLAKPEDRRFLIEEAAGIAKYKLRKQSAERKMEATQLNLSRVQDILGELEKSARSLERQVEKAEAFRSIQRDLKDLDSRVISQKVRRLDIHAIENEKKLTESRDLFQKASTLLLEQEASLEKFRLNALQSEKLNSTDTELFVRKKEEASRLQMEEELATQKVGLLKNQISEREKDLERIGSKFSNQEELRKKLDLEYEDLKKVQTQKNERLENLRKARDEAEVKLQSQETRLEEMQKFAEEARTQAAREGQKLDMMKSELLQEELKRAEREHSLEDGHAELTAVQNEIENLEKHALTCLKKMEDIRTAIADLDLQDDELQTKKEKIQAEIFEKRREEHELRTKAEALQTLEEHQVGYDSSMLEYSKVSGEKPVMDQVKFRADSQRLGELLLVEIGQCFTGSTKPDFAGRISRLVSTGTPNFSRSAFDLLESSNSPEIEKIFRSIELVDQISDSAPHAQLDRAGRFVWPLSNTLKLDVQGELKRDQNPFSRRQEREELETKASLVAKARLGSESNLAETQTAIENLKTRRTENETALQAQESEKSLTEKTRSERIEKRARLETRRDQLHSEMNILDGKLEGLRSSIGELSSTGMQALTLDEFAALKEDIQKARALKETADSEWIEFRIEMGALTERLERLKEQTLSVDMTQTEYSHNQGVFRQDIATWRSEIQRLEERKITLVEERATCQTEILGVEKRLAETKERLQKLHQDLEDAEKARRELQAQKDESQTSVQTLEMERQQLRHQVEELAHLLDERYQMRIEDLAQELAGEELISEEDLSNLEVKARIMRERVQKFGDVNLVALQEFEEIKKRLEFMTAQREDLLKTLDSLQSIIERINRITEFRFRETFQAINHNFQVIFPKVFGGGKAYMSLTDDKNLLDTGVEIFAEPPGKKIQAMSLLSGGEKAMTSISLLFSLFAYRPSSFCILDEVDAPLDDVNTRRYNEIIQEMSALSQFIVITHNKRTMEVADTLFGVTMQEPGVSKIVGVDLQAAKAFTATA